MAACEVGPSTRLIGAPIDADTIYLVLAGKLHLRLPTGNSTAAAGSMVLLPAGLQPGIAPSHEVSTEIFATSERLAQRGGLLVFDAARGQPGMLRVLVGRVRGDLAAKLGRPVDGKPLHVDLRGSALARSAYSALRAELDDPAPGFSVLAGALMKACLLLFVRATDEGGAAGPVTASAQRIAAVAAAIRARPADSYSIERLARLAGMSRATFARQFARYYAMTAMDYIMQVRLEDAAGLLRTTNLPVKQISADTGFQNRSHFSRAFQAHFDIDPSRYRAASGGSDAQLEHAPPPMLLPNGA